MSFNVFSWLKRVLEDFVRWVEERVNDPAVAEMILADLGFPVEEGKLKLPDLSKEQKERIEKLVEDRLAEDEKLEHLSEDRKEELEEEARQELLTEAVDAAAFAELALQVAQLIELGKVMVEIVDDDALDARDVFWAMAELFGAGWMELRNPAGHALMQILGAITSEDEEALERIDITRLPSIIERLGSDDDDTKDEAYDELIDRLLKLASVIAVVFDLVSGKEAFFAGWDPEPRDDEGAVAMASTALSFPIPPSGDVVVTLVGVTTDQGGPGIIVSGSGEFEFHNVEVAAEQAEKPPRYTQTFALESVGAVSFYVGRGGPRVFGRPDAALVGRGATLGTDPLLIGNPEETALRIDALAWLLRLGLTGSQAVLTMRGAKLQLDLGDGDGFLRSLLDERFEVGFDLDIIFDEHGLRLRSGSGLRTRLPITRSAIGPLTVQFLELVAGTDPYRLELAAGLTFALGPFQASLERVGFELAPSLDDEPADYAGFLRPSGVGLTIEFSELKGGGALFHDSAKSEYSGALELSYGSFGLSALGIIATKRPDGSDGTSVLLMVYAQFQISLGFGVFFTGAGGMIGLHHGVDSPALAAGLRSGALDDLLFPANPVANAPRLLNRYRQLFPFQEGTLVAGLAFEFEVGKPAAAEIRLGVIVELAGVLDDRSLAIDEWLLVGQVRVELPPRSLGGRPYLRLIVEAVGGHDAARGRTLIRGGLRDSFVGAPKGPRVTLAGEFFFCAWRDDPEDDGRAWLGTVGGWHPDQPALPPDVPSDIARLLVAFKVSIVSLRLTLYYAFTPETRQFGFGIELTAKFGPAKIHGLLTVDALINRDTDRFTADIVFKASVKIWGKGLGVEIEGRLSGPSLWQVQGKAKIKILFKSFTIDIDVEAGSAPELDRGSIDAAAELHRVLSDPASLTPRLPAESGSIASFADPGAATDLLHPLGTLRIDQVAIPLDITITRVGRDRIEGGPTRFRIRSIRLGDEPPQPPILTSGRFAMGQFTDMSDADRLANAFDRLPNGVLVGSPDYVTPPSSQTVSTDHEVRRYEAKPEPAGGGAFEWGFQHTRPANLNALVISKMVAAVASPQFPRSATASFAAQSTPARTTSPTLAFVNREDLQVAATPMGSAAESPRVAAAQLADQPSLMAVPAFELQAAREQNP